MASNISWQKLQRMHSKGIHKLQSKKLRSMLTNFMMTPYYHSLFKVNNIALRKILSPADLVRLPFTSKEDVISTVAHPEKSSAFVVDPTKHLHTLPTLTTFKLFFSSNLKKELVEEFKQVHVHFTKGRDAIPIPILYTKHDLDNLHTAAERIMSYLKVPSSVRVVNSFPFGPDLSFWQSVYATNHLGIFGLHTGGGVTMGTEKIVAALERMQAEVLVGTPSYVMHLAMHAVERQKNLSHLRTILLSGESVTPLFVHKLREVLAGCRVTHVDVRSTYAFAEGKVAWTQCHEESGYHLYPDMEYIEIVDESGRRVADGDTGEIVYTSLDFRGTVFLRYKTGDFGRLEVGPCQYCDTKTPRLSPIITRAHEIRPLHLTKTKKALVDFNAVRAFLGGLRYLDAWQIHLKKKSTLDEVVLYISVRHEDVTFAKKELTREMQNLFNIKPQIIEKKNDELVDMIGTERDLEEKRIIDDRQ
jgi:phenylacetate-CoA ligase